MEVELQPTTPRRAKVAKKAKDAKPLSLAEMRRGRGGHTKAAPPRQAKALRFAPREEQADDDDPETGDNLGGSDDDSDDEEQLLGDTLRHAFRANLLTMHLCRWEHCWRTRSTRK